MLELGIAFAPVVHIVQFTPSGLVATQLVAVAIATNNPCPYLILLHVVNPLADNGLFLIVHDEHKLKADLNSDGAHIDQHQCHHISVLGLPTNIVSQSRVNEKIFNLIEPLFFIQSFPNLIEYPPKNT